MDHDEVVKRGQSEVGGSVAQISVHVPDADEFLQLLPLLAAAHVVQQAGDIVQRGIGEDLRAVLELISASCGQNKSIVRSRHVTCGLSVARNASKTSCTARQCDSGN